MQLMVFISSIKVKILRNIGIKCVIKVQVHSYTMNIFDSQLCLTTLTFREKKCFDKESVE